MNHNTNKLVKNQSGLVSMTVVMVLMVVITLIVIGFATIARREERQALDRQLSTQAFYAAETGVNDAIKVLNSNPAAQKPNCDNTGADPAYSSLTTQLDGTTTGYTCLLVDTTLDSLTYDNIGTDKSTIIPLNSSADINSITVSWQDTDSGSTFTSCPSAGTFPNIATWNALNNINCNAGVLRVDVVPTPASGAAYTRANLRANAFTTFFSPRPSGAFLPTVNYSTSDNDKGSVIAASCNAAVLPRLCVATINTSTLPGINTRFTLRVRSIYKANALTVCVNSSDCSSGSDLTGAQILIDSTGKANDVLRRIVVRKPINQSDSDAPDFAIATSDSICKRMVVSPGSTTTDSADPACAVN